MTSRRPHPHFFALAGILLASLVLSGCSVRKLAVNSLAKALTEGNDAVFATDDDPDLVGDALPFALKTLEALVAQVPENRDLLLSTCTGFLQYSYAYVEMEAVRLEPDDYRAAVAERERALRLYLRARGYCWRALDLRQAGTVDALRATPETAVDRFDRAEDVELLYGAGLAWGAAIAAGLDRPGLVADLPAVQALLSRALDLDPNFQDGAIHEAMIAVEGLPEEMGGSLEDARRHYERALELSNGRRPSIYVAWASLVSAREQNREEFEELLEKALAIDADAHPETRLATLIAQQRARLLLDQIDLLFF